MAGQKSDILPEEERFLLQAIAAGDSQAFRTLVTIFWPRVYGNTLTLVKSSQAAEEITQDIFLKIWQQKEKLADVQSFKHYIYVVGRNRIISQLRKKVAQTEEATEYILEDRLMPDKQLQYKETYQVIMDGIAHLTPQQQLIFKMSRLDGLSYEEIGRELGLSKNTVKGHMVLALHYLRIYVRDHADITIICFLLLQPMLQNNF